MKISFFFRLSQMLGLRMTEESSPHWGLKWAVVQMTQPIAHCIFVSSVRKATTPQQVTPQACCDIWHWNSAQLSARPLNRKTTHQNSPLHLCLEVSVNESHKRLPLVHILCDACVTFYILVAVAPWLAQVVTVTPNPPDGLNNSLPHLIYGFYSEIAPLPFPTEA